MFRIKSFRLLAVLAVLVSCGMLLISCQSGNSASRLRFQVSFSQDLCADALDGRMLLLIAASDAREPRFQTGDSVDSAQVFGIDVDAMGPGDPAIFDAGVFGFPIDSLSNLPPGEYWVQALLHRYETFNRSDGHTVKLPMDRGEGQKWNRAPGNLYSTPQKMTVDPRKNVVLSITLDQEIPPIPDPPETKYIKHVKIQSEMLTEFWGRPMHLGAHVLLPEGWEEHPDARYPLVIYHGHFPYNMGGFRETPPDPDLEPEYSSRFDWEGYNITSQEYAYKFYQYWKAPDTPRMIVIQVQHANPYYDDSYAVNSANLGPYGDAIIHELVPYIEKKYRGIGEGWARFTYGGSTGGWEALAVQVLYPDEYNGCFAACPDPIDFRAYTVVNIYEDTNAYFLEGPFKRSPRPGRRNWLGHVSCSMADMNLAELAIANRGRSGGQWDIWQAVYSPVGDDGYPKPIWDKRTGVIDHSVAEYWKENYDLGYILRRDWKTIGPRLKGKLHIYVGDMDNYYLNNAVYLVEDFLESTTSPYYDGDVDYGDRAEHCWNGDHMRPNALSRLRYHQMFAPVMVQRMIKNHPPGADLKSWRY